MNSDRGNEVMRARPRGLIVASLEWVAARVDRFRYVLLQQEWFNSVVMPAIPRSVRWNLRKLYFRFADLVESPLDEADDLIPPKSLIFVGTVDFKEGGRHGIERLVRMGVITPDSRVLDIGCGIGRLAIPLTSYLQGGTYDGLDIVPSGIEWCNEHIARTYPNFTFTLADIFNKDYNPAGRLAASDYRFPYQDESFDLVLLISVFTHMLPQDLERYVSEISRVLRPGGRCWASVYLVNPDSIERMQTGKACLRLKYDHGTYWTVSERVPELSIGYEERYIKELFERNGLALDEGVHYGGWCGRPPLWEEGNGNLDDQDLLLSTKGM